MANFMYKDVHNELPGRGPHKIVHEIEILRDVPIPSWKIFYEFLQIPTALTAKLKERLDASVGNRNRIGKWSVQEPVNITLLGRKNVPHHITDGLKTTVAMRPG